LDVILFIENVQGKSDKTALVCANFLKKIWPELTELEPHRVTALAPSTFWFRLCNAVE
jgi:hypothetical protein